MASNQAPIVDRIRIIPRPEDFLDRNVGSSGEVFFNRETATLRVYDGRQAGGYEVLTQDNLVNAVSQSNIATVNYTVTITNTGEGNKYILNGVYKPALNFVIGYTYEFNQDDPTNVYYPNPTGGENNQHPLNFSADNLNGELGGGTNYTSGVSYILDDVIVTKQQYWDGFENASTRRVRITVSSSTPTTLYYWCQNHLNMGNEITVAAPGTGTGAGGASVDVSDTLPDDPENGNIWFNSDTGRLYVYISDADSSQWVQPTVPVPSINAFSRIAFADSTQFSASGSDTLKLLDGPGIEISSDPIAKTITISNTREAGSGGEAYDQSLNTTDSVSFASVSSPSFINTGVGSPTFTSASSLTLNSADGVVVTGAQFRLPSFDTTNRNLLTPANGDLIYNTSVNKIQAYQNSGWINLEDGSAA